MEENDIKTISLSAHEEKEARLRELQHVLGILIQTISLDTSVVNVFTKDMNEMLSTVTDSEQYLNKKKYVDDAKSKIEENRKKVNSLALEVKELTGQKKINDNISFRMITTMKYDPNLAIEWCKNNLKKAVTIDFKLFEKHAKAINETSPIEFVEVKEEPQLVITLDK